jgi:hypothetical protein
LWLSQEAGDPFFVLAYGGLGGIVLLCSCHHFFESLSLCLRILAYQTKPGRSLQGELQPFAVYGAVLASVWPYYLSAGTACINITLTLLESISDQAWQKLARRTAALFAVYGAVLASVWPYYLSAGTACINITLTLLESISDQAWQKLARRTAALFAVYGAVLASAWPYQEHRHNT